MTCSTRPTRAATPALRQGHKKSNYFKSKKKEKKKAHPDATAHLAGVWRGRQCFLCRRCGWNKKKHQLSLVRRPQGKQRKCTRRHDDPPPRTTWPPGRCHRAATRINELFKLDIIQPAVTAPTPTRSPGPEDCAQVFGWKERPSNRRLHQSHGAGSTLVSESSLPPFRTLGAYLGKDKKNIYIHNWRPHCCCHLAGRQTRSSHPLPCVSTNLRRQTKK